MNQVLLVDLPESDAEPVNWLVWDREAGRKIAGGALNSLEQLSELQGYTRQYPSYALVPGELASCFQVTMPTSGRTAEAALPYQVEELLCSDIDEQLIAHEKIAAGKAVDVVVVKRELMQRWHRALQQAELRIKAMVPDYLLLPDNCILIEAQRVLVNCGQHRAAVDDANFQVWWQLAHSDNASTESPGVFLTVDEATWLPEEVADCKRAGSRLEALAQSMHAPGLNLLQGSFSLRDPMREGLQAIRWPAIAALVVLLLHWVTLGVQIAVAQRERAVLDSAITDVYKETFPSARRVVNPRSQMRSQLMALQRSGADSRLLPWLENTAVAMRQHKDIKLNQMNFQQQPQALKLVLDVPSYASIDRLSQSLMDSGVRVERGTFSQKGEGISGQLIIREGAQ